MSRYSITPAQAHAACDEIVSEYDEIRTYSGRGMFGRECLALVGSSGSGAPTEFMFDLAVALSADGDGDVELWDVRERITALANDMRTDSLGRSTVYYWPNVTVDGDLDDE